MIDDLIILETIRPPLVAPHSRSDLLSPDIVLESLRS
jgi:hypothetical protein